MTKQISVPVSALTILLAGSLSTASAQAGTQPVATTVSTAISAADLAAWAAEQPSIDPPIIIDLRNRDNDCGSDHTHTVDCDGSTTQQHTSARLPEKGDNEQVSVLARKFDV